MPILTINNVLAGGVLLRAGMLFYGLWQDAHMNVKYTDIDYSVFTDAARSVWNGGSPYERSTYRYTPLLAWLLTPNIWLHPTFGKWLFVLCDCIVGYLIIRILRERKLSEQTAAAYSMLWLLNPQVATISTRGSAEATVCATVMAAFYAFQRKHVIWGAIWFGISVHLKIYPIIYALPMLIVLDRATFSSIPKPSLSLWGKIRYEATKQRLMFFLVSGSVFVGLNIVFYIVYGREFLDETYIYHISRKDHRHNYSMWFLPIYLKFFSPASITMGLLSFLPQALVVTVLGFAFGKDLYFATFLQTFAFVAFNKVCTAQYFMWYICLLPVIWPYNTLRLAPDTLLLIAVWFGSQALYLQQAYRLEFLGENTFNLLWAAGAIIFTANIWILYKLINSQRVVPLFKSTVDHKKTS
ncbi:GPI mannosyltransferase 1 [Coemansia sp. RSA 989]|nr:PIG-M-domain-containing protein [Coemansia mojavensis]KAJ1867089.1 GPI mannosyltransferase 1 [Coemansia sp. RSA 989]